MILLHVPDLPGWDGVTVLVLIGALALWAGVLGGAFRQR